jgi:hypothetical protein
MLGDIELIFGKRLLLITGDLALTLADYLRPVGVSNGTVFLRSRRGAGLQFRVHWVRTGVALRPWFACLCGRNVRRLYCDDDVWACRRCHKLAYAAMMDPDRRHWVGSGKILRILRMLGSDSADPFSPLPPRDPGMWRKSTIGWRGSLGQPRSVYFNRWSARRNGRSHSKIIRSHTADWSNSGRSCGRVRLSCGRGRKRVLIRDIGRRRH